MQREKKRVNIFVLVLIAVLIIFFGVTVFVLSVRLNDLNKTRESLEKQLNELQVNYEQIKEELEEPFDEKYIVRIAREKLGYHLPGEILFYNDLASD